MDVNNNSNLPSYAESQLPPAYSEVALVPVAEETPPAYQPPTIADGDALLSLMANNVAAVADVAIAPNVAPVGNNGMANNVAAVPNVTFVGDDGNNWLVSMITNIYAEAPELNLRW
jgi:hypothetical protein